MASQQLEPVHRIGKEICVLWDNAIHSLMRRSFTFVILYESGCLYNIGLKSFIFSQKAIPLLAKMLKTRWVRCRILSAFSLF